MPRPRSGERLSSTPKIETKLMSQNTAQQNASAPAEVRAQEYIETCEKRRLKLKRLMEMQGPMERIVAKLPDGIMVSLSDEWVQISSPTREQVLEVLKALNAGKWDKTICHANGEKLDYETTIEGIKVIMFYSEPPTSCRIEIEEVDVPAHKETHRKLVCV